MTCHSSLLFAILDMYMLFFVTSLGWCRAWTTYYFFYLPFNSLPPSLSAVISTQESMQILNAALLQISGSAPKNLFLIFGDRTRGLDDYDLLTQNFKVTAGQLPISELEHHSAAESRPQCRTQDICSRLPDIVSRTQYLNSRTHDFSSRTQDLSPELKALGPELTILVEEFSDFSRQQS